MNTRRLRQIQKLILKYPQRFDLYNWYGVGAVPDKRDRFIYVVPAMEAPSCGTTACIAGWAVAKYDGTVIREDSMEKQAAEILGLTKRQAGRLFYIDDWPDAFLDPYENARDVSDAITAANIAADRIDHFIKTKGAE